MALSVHTVHYQKSFKAAWRDYNNLCGPCGLNVHIPLIFFSLPCMMATSFAVMVNGGARWYRSVFLLYAIHSLVQWNGNWRTLNSCYLLA